MRWENEKNIKNRKQKSIDNNEIADLGVREGIK